MAGFLLSLCTCSKIRASNRYSDIEACFVVIGVYPNGTGGTCLSKYLGWRRHLWRCPLLHHHHTPSFIVDPEWHLQCVADERWCLKCCRTRRVEPLNFKPYSAAYGNWSNGRARWQLLEYCSRGLVYAITLQNVIQWLIAELVALMLIEDFVLIFCRHVGIGGIWPDVVVL